MTGAFLKQLRLMENPVKSDLGDLGLKVHNLLYLQAGEEKLERGQNRAGGGKFGENRQ